MRILVVGATGVLGRNVVPRLIERGHAVRALVRRQEQAATLHRLGIEAVTGDILDSASLFPAASGCDAALHIATAIPRKRSDALPDWVPLNDCIRREGTANLLAACEAGGISRYVQQSITFLYGECAGIVDERTPIRPLPRHQSAVDAEALVLASSLGGSILRGGAFYGPGTGSEEEWRAEASRGDLRLPGDGEGFVSLIHVVDMARAVLLAVEGAARHSIYNVVDDAPVCWRELLGYVAAQIGQSGPGPGGPATLPPAAVSNARIKKNLGWLPVFPTFRSGLVL